MPLKEVSTIQSLHYGWYVTQPRKIGGVCASKFGDTSSILRLASIDTQCQDHDQLLHTNSRDST